MVLKKVLSSSYEDCDSAGTSIPALAKVSVINTDCPPVIATSPTRRPLIGRLRANIASASTSASQVRTSTAPPALTIAFQTAPGVASDAVWEKVARAPASVTPPFQMTTGG